MTRDEEEILWFYKDGSSIEDLAYSYEYSQYQIKRFLAITESKFRDLGYQPLNLTEWFNP